MKLWVVIANSSSAEIYAVEHNGRDMHKVQHLEFPKGREKSGEILSDRPGRGFEGSKQMKGAFGRHAYSSETDIRTQEQQIFAHKLEEILRKAKDENVYEHLAIIAPPQFLGVLRGTLSDGVRKLIIKEINKDIPASQTDQERIESICRYLDLKRPVSTPGI